MPNIVVENYQGVEMEQVKNAPSAKNPEIRLKEAVLDRLLEANDIEVPQNLVDDEVNLMILELQHRVKYESLTTGRITRFTQDDLAKQMEEFKEEAFKLVKTRLMLKGIIEAEGFTVTKDELEQEAKAIAVRQQMPVEMVKDFLGQDLEQLKDDLLVRKAIDFVYANSVIKYGMLLPECRG